MIYLDYAATTPLDEEVFGAMLPYLKESFGNADSLHAYGRKSAYAVEDARARVAEVLGVKPAEIYFTSGGTEADNWAVRCLGEGSVCVSAIEHHAVLETAGACGRGHTVAEVTRDGVVMPALLQNSVTERTGLVCVMAVNNETGVVQPVKELARFCAERGTLFFCDCVQAAGELDLKEILKHCDAISLSAHKIYGPKGAGALVVKKGAKLRPLLTGGTQERGLRGGTLNVAGIVGFAAALERAQAERERTAARLRELRGIFEVGLKAALGDAVKIDGERAERVGAISHVTFECGGEGFLSALDMAGVAAAGGAACSAHSHLPSHVMLASGASAKEALSGVRFSFGRNTAVEEVEKSVQIVAECASARKKTL